MYSPVQKIIHNHSSKVDHDDTFSQQRVNHQFLCQIIEIILIKVIPTFTNVTIS